MSEISALQVSTLWPHLTALYCATLLPLAAGLPPIVAIVESVHVMTGREIWKQAARFWGRLFGVALLTWAAGMVVLAALYVANPDSFARHFLGMPSPVLVGFGLPFVLTAGWLLWSRYRNWPPGRGVGHLAVTWSWTVLLGLVVLKIAIGFGFLDHPVGAAIDPDFFQVQIRDLPAMLLNPAAQSRFVHVMGACFLTGATFVLSVSAWYLLRNRNVQIARRSMTVAAAFGLAAALSLALLGDRAGYASSPGQQMRIAAIAAEWHTRDAPAPFTVFGLPDGDARITRAAVEIPSLLGFGATHSWRKRVPGLDELEAANAARIREGVASFESWNVPGSAGSRHASGVADHGYVLLLLRHTGDPSQVDDGLIAAAARDTVPSVPLLFWSFRAMVLLEIWSLVLFGGAFWLASKRRLGQRTFLQIAAWSLPVPWLAGVMGWTVSEAGRGVWLVDGLLPVTAAHMDRFDVVTAVAACAAMLGLVAIAATWFVRLVRLGPDGLKLWAVDSGRAGSY